MSSVAASSTGPLRGRGFVISVGSFNEAVKWQRLILCMGGTVRSPETIGTELVHELAPVRELLTHKDATEAMTPLWLSYQSHLDYFLKPSLSPLFRPLGGSEGVPEMRALVLTLTGMKGEFKR